MPTNPTQDEKNLILYKSTIAFTNELTENIKTIATETLKLCFGRVLDLEAVCREELKRRREEEGAEDATPTN